MSRYVSEAITGAVSQSSLQIVGMASAMAMASLYQTMAHSTGLMFENSVAAQRQQFILS